MKGIFTLATVLLFLLFNTAYQPKMAASAPPVELSQATTKPSPRAGHSLVYDEEQRQVVLMDGYPPSNQPEFTEVWAWDGKQWRIIPGSGPAARTLSGAAYDSRRKRIVSYGGIRGLQESRSDTWEWDGNSWQQMTDTSVGTHDHHVMVYDEARGKTVMYGGVTSNRSLSPDTWEWDGAKWTRVATQGPGGRAHFAMVYDSSRQQVVLFGGLGEGELYRNDTWVWDGAIWRKVSDEGPPPRARHRMAFDSRAGVVLLYGGDEGMTVTPSGQSFKLLEDMWQWDGQRWSEIRTTGLGKRFMHAMAYDAARGKTVLYGGNDGQKDFNDTWEWDGTHWEIASEQVVLYRGNPQRTGSYDEEAINQLSGIKWQTSIGPSANAGPIIADGMIYIGCQDGRFYAIDSQTGQTRWTFRAKPATDVLSSAAIADGVVYVGAKKWLYAIDSLTGEQLWKFKAKKRILTALLVAGGMIFFGVEDGKFYAVDIATHQQRLKLSKRPPLLFNPAFDQGIVYIPERSALYAVRSETGEEVWKIENGMNWYSPAVSDGIVYVGNDDGLFYALNAQTGATQWTFNAASGGWSSPAIRNGIVLVGNRNNHFYALNSQTGEKLWEFVAEDWAVTDPIVAGGTVYFGVGNHDNLEGERFLYALDAETGQELWRFKADSRLLTSAALMNGTLYVASFRGTLYALQ